MANRNYDESLCHSASDLSSVIMLRREAEALSAIASFVGCDDAREIVDEVNSELDGLVSLVDGFYKLLGNSNWVFSNALNIERMRVVVSKPNSEEAESELIAYLQEEGVLHDMINRLRRFPDMRPRIPLLQSAECDYLAGRYYSSVLVTISMMDGFVNDAFKDERRGLAARGAEEMAVDDCVAAIWDGLPSVQRVFTRTCGRRNEEPVSEVYRHGIMHGMTLGYNNVVVASKAWCMLFAVADWVDARAKSSEKKDTESADPFKTIKHLIDIQAASAETNKKLDEWEPHSVDFDDLSEHDKEVFDSCNSYLSAWKEGNYGKLGSFFADYLGRTSGMLAGEARELYAPHPIDNYHIVSLERPAAARATVTARLSDGDHTWTAVIAFIRLSGDKPAAEWEFGEWKVMQYGVAPFVETSDMRK